jgi:hypothetical protein
MSSTVPVMTFNTAGNVISSGSISASGTTNASVDYSGVWEARVHVKNTPGASVHATRGVRVDVFDRYGSTPTTGESADRTWTLPSATASTAESLRLTLEMGKWNIKLTNLDGTNAVTDEVTGDTVTSLSTT